MQQVFVKNLPAKIPAHKVVDYFSKFGNIVKYKVSGKDNSAWIAYDVEECAEIATSRAPHLLMGRRVYVQRNWYHEYLRKEKKVRC